MVGTVDKFQGQEAPVCLVSMTSSSADEIPRGMDFLFSLNRINVAVSRAQVLSLVFARPRLLEVSQRRPVLHQRHSAFISILASLRVTTARTKDNKGGAMLGLVLASGICGLLLGRYFISGEEWPFHAGNGFS